MLFNRYKSALLKAEAQNARQQETLSALNRHMALIEFSPQGEILDVSAPFCKVMGYDREQLIGRHHRIFCSEQYSGSTAYRGFWQSLARGEGCSDRFQRFKASGDEVWLEASYIPVRNAAGQVVRVVKIAADVTDDVKREQEQTSILGAIDRSMAIIEFNLDGNIIKVNRNFVNTMGYSEKELIGQHHRLLGICSTCQCRNNEFAAGNESGSAYIGHRSASVCSQKRGPQSRSGKLTDCFS